MKTQCPGPLDEGDAEMRNLTIIHPARQRAGGIFRGIPISTIHSFYRKMLPHNRESHILYTIIAAGHSINTSEILPLESDRSTNSIEISRQKGINLHHYHVVQVKSFTIASTPQVPSIPQ